MSGEYESLVTDQDRSHKVFYESPTPSTLLHRATILENLALARSLEAASGRDSILLALGGYASSVTGTPCPGDGWAYLFAAQPNQRLYAWSVYGDGGIQFPGEKSDAPGPNLGSDELIRMSCAPCP